MASGLWTGLFPRTGEGRARSRHWGRAVRVDEKPSEDAGVPLGSREREGDGARVETHCPQRQQRAAAAPLQRRETATGPLDGKRRPATCGEIPANLSAQQRRSGARPFLAILARALPGAQVRRGAQPPFPPVSRCHRPLYVSLHRAPLLCSDCEYDNASCDSAISPPTLIQ